MWFLIQSRTQVLWRRHSLNCSSKKQIGQIQVKFTVEIIFLFWRHSFNLDGQVDIERPPVEL